MAPPAPKPYLYAEELAALTPWSVEAIRKKVQRGELKLGTHYFQEQRRGRLIFKWDAVVEVIERKSGERAGCMAQNSRPTKVIDVEEATERLRRLQG